MDQVNQLMYTYDQPYNCLILAFMPFWASSANLYKSSLMHGVIIFKICLRLMSALQTISVPEPFSENRIQSNTQVVLLIPWALNFLNFTISRISQSKVASLPLNNDTNVQVDPTCSRLAVLGVMRFVLGSQSDVFSNLEKYYHTLASGAGAYSVNVSLTIFYYLLQMSIHRTEI